MSEISVKKAFDPDIDVFEGMVSVRSVFEGKIKGVCDRKIVSVLFSEDKIKGNGKLLGFLKAKSFVLGYELKTVSEEEIERYATGNSHGGVIMLAEKRKYPYIPENPPKNGFYVILDGIEDPYNLGYAIRSVYAAGADGVILPKRSPIVSAGIVCRSSAGASELMEISCGDICEITKHLKSYGYRLALADENGEKVSYSADLKKPLLLAVGGEKRGFSKQLSALTDISVKLEYGRDFPMALSAASATAVLAFEVSKQNKN